MGCFGLGDALWVWTLRRTTSGGLTCPKSGLFVVTQQRGAKHAKKEESESKNGQKQVEFCGNVSAKPGKSGPSFLGGLPTDGVLTLLRV